MADTPLLHGMVSCLQESKTRDLRSLSWKVCRKAGREDNWRSNEGTEESNAGPGEGGIRDRCGTRRHGTHDDGDFPECCRWHFHLHDFGPRREDQLSGGRSFRATTLFLLPGSTIHDHFTTDDFLGLTGADSDSAGWTFLLQDTDPTDSHRESPRKFDDHQPHVTRRPIARVPIP